MEEACTCGLSMQLPYHIETKIQVPYSRRGYRENSRREYTSDMRMERCRNTGAQRNERPCAYGSGYYSEGIDIRTDGDTEREKSDSIIQRQACAQEETVLVEPFLEPGILWYDRIDGGR